ncbi:MAG: LacI family DNA-binding transcriptional regulator [bacterium]|nr:LacI family DNA-binding transcriptional regulator [bacterium]
MSTHPQARQQTSSARALSRDVAVAAGVSQSTVSRALRDDPRISSATRERVRLAAQQLGYVPNSVARNLRERRSRVVGVMVEDIDNAFYQELLADMHQELLLAGYAFTLIVDPLHLRSDVARLTHLLDASLDGLIVTTATLGSDAPATLQRRGVPMVLSVRSVPNLQVDIVESDNVAAGQLAARHLVSLGHQDVAAVMGPEVTSTTQDRIVGAKQVFGHSLLPHRVLHGPYSHESGHAHCRRLLQSEQPPTAIMAANDVLAIGVMDAARQMGYSIPEDVSVIGFDDIQMASWHSFRLTTVRQDTKSIAVQSARRLIERIEDPNSPITHDKFPVSLTMRSTTAPPK